MTTIARGTEGYSRPIFLSVEFTTGKQEPCLITDKFDKIDSEPQTTWQGAPFPAASRRTDKADYNRKWWVPVSTSEHVIYPHLQCKNNLGGGRKSTCICLCFYLHFSFTSFISTESLHMLKTPLLESGNQKLFCAAVLTQAASLNQFDFILSTDSHTFGIIVLCRSSKNNLE